MSDSNTVSPVPSITASDLLNFALDHAPNKAKKEVCNYVREKLSQAPVFNTINKRTNTFLDKPSFRNQIPTAFNVCRPQINAFITKLLKETHILLLNDKTDAEVDPFENSGEFERDAVRSIAEKLIPKLNGKPEEIAAHVLLLFYNEFLASEGTKVHFTSHDERKARLIEVLNNTVDVLAESDKTRQGAEAYKFFVEQRHPQLTQSIEPPDVAVEPKTSKPTAKPTRKTKTSTSAKSRVAKLVSDGFDSSKSNPSADCVLTTARKPQEGVYEVLALHPEQTGADPNHNNPDYHLQYGGRLDFRVASPTWSPDENKYVSNVYKESAAIVFWGSAGTKLGNLDALKAEAAERAAAQWREEILDGYEWELDPDAYLKAVNEAYEEWKKYFIENCTIVEYGIGAGLLDAASAVGGIAELNINRMARWDETNSKWTLPVQTGLNEQNQIAYTLNLAGNGVSRFINDINEVRWNPTLHITTQDELKAYNDAIKNGQTYVGSSNQTSAPDQADLPVSLVVSGTLGENNSIVSAGTLVMSGHASYSGSTDVINGATLVVDGIIDNDVQSDATATVAGRGVVGSLTSRGTLSPGDDLSPGNRIGTFHVQGQLKLEAGSSLVLDVGEHTIDQIIVGNLSQDQTSSLTLLAKSGQESNADAPLNITIRTGQYVDQTITLSPTLFFPGLNAGDEILEQVKDAELSWGGGITFTFRKNDDGSFEMHRVENSMQLVGKTVSLSQDAMRRAQKLDAVIQADGILSGTAAEFVSAVDILSENLRDGHPESDRQLVATTLENAFASTKADSHLAFDAAAMSRSIRLREVTALSPLTDLYATDVIPEASLVVERANMDGAKSFQSTRTILSAGARRSFGDWALGWKVGGYYDDIEISGPDKGNAQGVFASVSAMREFGAGMRLFGQALLGYGVEDRTRYVSDFDVSKRLDTTTHAVSLGASIGIGRKFAPDQIALSFMPYAQLSWDGIHRDDVRESDSRVAQEYEDELLSVAALEAGLAFKTRSSAASPTGNLFLEGRIAYRNRFHVNGDETYTWTGIRDETNVEFFDNRHAAAAQCKIGWVSSTGHEFALMLDGEAGDSGDERWGASLRWTKHF